MKDEIKEILERLKIKSDRYNHHLKYNMSYENKDEDYEAHLLLDCITNLQEENKKLKQNLEQMYNDTKDTYNEICAEQIDYKSRNEKAIEYMNNHQLVFELSSKKQVQYWFDMFYKDLLNILQGSDKDE